MSDYKKGSYGSDIPGFDYIINLISNKKEIEGSNLLLFVETLEEIVEKNDVQAFQYLKKEYLEYFNASSIGYRDEKKVRELAYKNFENIALLVDNSNVDTRKTINSLVAIVNQKQKLNQVKRSKASLFVKSNF
ncbi:MAG: hypothetical protein PHT94_01470 [Candidatus Nanoarchaeia archaeon]|nr:hypothetical protein [Candidatus Nanoarchaeia archaeon]